MALSTIERFFQKVALGENLEELKNVVNCKDQENDQKSPLHNASANGNLKIVKALILLGAQVEAKDNFGKTPLHVASYADVAKCLIQNGAKMEAKDEDEQTPLH